MSACVKSVHRPVHREVGKAGRKAGGQSAASLYSAGLLGKSQLFFKDRREEARLGGRDREQEAALRNSTWN